MRGRTGRTGRLSLTKFKRRDQRVDQILKDGPRYVEEARERARQQIAEEMRRKQTRHKVA